MNQITRLLLQALICWPFILGLLVVTEINAGSAGIKTMDSLPAEEATSAADTYKNYSGLSDLITTVCDDALERFQDFYSPAVITVEPFATIDLLENNKQSELGVILADQMTAVLNNGTMKTKGHVHGSTAQKLTGLLQEVDGYLRIHLSGINAAGERASYVVSVEMSEPIYRALHTYL